VVHRQGLSSVEGVYREVKKEPYGKGIPHRQVYPCCIREDIAYIYLEKGRALKDVPTLRMLYEKKETIGRRARRMLKKLKAILPGLDVVVKEVSSEVGGGSLPDISIPSFGLLIRPATMGVRELERELRKQPVPIISRIEKDRLIIDLRTVASEDDTYIISSLETILEQERGEAI
jgi:L-seryl-tRNA(Ser) seleniumtransferase